MKRTFLLTFLIVALCVSICSQVWAKDKVKADPWDEKLFTEIISVFADKELSPEEKTDKIMGLASHTEIVAMLNLLVNSPKADDECIRCLKGCNRAYCACASGCDVMDDACWSRCVSRFVGCMAGCGCRWEVMY